MSDPYLEDLYNIELQIREKKRQLAKLEEKQAAIQKERDLWKQRGSNPLPMSEVREEYAK